MPLRLVSSNRLGEPERTGPRLSPTVAACHSGFVTGTNDLRTVSRDWLDVMPLRPHLATAQFASARRFLAVAWKTRSCRQRFALLRGTNGSDPLLQRGVVSLQCRVRRSPAIVWGRTSRRTQSQQDADIPGLGENLPQRCPCDINRQPTLPSRVNPGDPGQTSRRCPHDAKNAFRSRNSHWAAFSAIDRFMVCSICSIP
jgi:hypothetical protein